MKRLTLLSLFCLIPTTQSMDYVKYEAIQKSAALLKAAMDAEAVMALNEIILPAIEKAKARCFAKAVNDEVLDCMGMGMAPHEAEGALARESVLKKYAQRIDRVLADYDAEGCY